MESNKLKDADIEERDRPTPIHLLHVEDNLSSTRRIDIRLKHHPVQRFVLTAVNTLQDAKLLLAQKHFDIALIDLNLPDSQGLSTLDALHRFSPLLPIVVLAGNEDANIIDALIAHGAQDYLHKNEASIELILRVIIYAIERKRMERKLVELSNFDGLTHLINRTIFIDRLTHCLKRYERSPSKLAVMFIDLDRFKSINDALGHPYGDRLLKEVAQRLLASVRAVDTVARLGGDEFCVLLEDISSNEIVVPIAEKILRALENPITIEEQSWHPYASIGVAISDPQSRAAELIKQADIAMYRAKQNGGHRFEFFTTEMQALALLQANIDRALRAALENNEFRAFYQPLFNLRTGQLLGAETLLRWQHPEMGLVGPNLFIPQLESSGQIVEVTEWIIRESVRTWVRLQKEGLLFKGARLSINLSPVMIRHPRCVDKIQALLDETKIAQESLVFEITEGTFLDHQGVTIGTLNALREMGLGIAIDDFGTGYSSMSYLKHFNITCIKLDRSFIQGMLESPTDLSIAKSVIMLTRDLKVDLVAEGVDAQAKVDLLKVLDCPIVQGFFYSKPLPEDEFINYLKVCPQPPGTPISRPN